MSDPDDIDMIAAEYALGTLDRAEREAAALRRTQDHALERAIQRWETLLAPLNEAAPPMTPSADLLDRILARLQLTDSASRTRAAEVVVLQTRLRRWRTGAFALGALAACLVVAIGARESMRLTEPRNFVAVMQKDSVSPAFIVSVDLDTRALTIRAVAADAQPGKSYELWLVNETLGAPRSLGLLRAEGLTIGPRLANYAPAIIENATYAVSLEPERGSPTGAPTGPVLFSGKLVATGL